jgi:Immunity protein 52
MKTYFDYALRSAWRDRVESLVTLGGKFVETLDALTRIDPVLFANWELFDLSAPSSCALAEVRSYIASLVEKNVALDDLGNALPDYGYSMVGLAGKFKDPRSAEFWARAEGKYERTIELKLAHWDVAPDPAIVTYSLFKAALLAINPVWLPSWACAYAFRVDYYKVPLFLGTALFPFSDFHIPWLAYLSAPLSAGLELHADILTERTPDGGLLMSATEERLDPTNPEHLARARVIAETMMACTGCRATDLEEFARVRRFTEQVAASMGGYAV